MATLRVAAKPEVAPMKVAQISKPGGDFEIVKREIPEPDFGQVRIKVQACGVCHSDVLTKEGLWPGIQYPRVPGHEVAGIVDEVGAGVTAWKKGQRVGVGWHGGHDGTCRECRRGDFRNCRNQKIAGISYDGGYQEFMVAPVEALAAIPDGVSDVEAAPLLCAGITTYNALGTVVRCKASAAWVTWGFSSRTNLVTESRLSDAAPKTRHWQKSLEQAYISTAQRRTLPRHYNNSEAQA